MREEVPYEVYLPYRQMNFVNGMTVYARVRGDAAGALALLPKAVREMDAGVPLYDLRTVDHQVENSLVTERLLATLSAGFGALATLLAAIGLYGVMAYLVARRTREIGIRMALGASGGSVAWMVMREVLALAGVGVACGLLVALWATRLVAAQLFGVEPADPATLMLAAAGIAVVAIVSGYLPARRATAIDPMRALHWE